MRNISKCEHLDFHDSKTCICQVYIMLAMNVLICSFLFKVHAYSKCAYVYVES